MAAVYQAVVMQTHSVLYRKFIMLYPRPTLALFLGLFFGLVFGASSAKAEMEKFNTAQLKSLDKITARTQDLTVRVGETIQYGPLFITLRTCRKSPPIETPRTVAFLEIAEKTPDRGDKWIFSGWMFASSPALSSMDHPVYDVWVIDCENGEPYVPEVAKIQNETEQGDAVEENAIAEEGAVPDAGAEQDAIPANTQERPIRLEEAIQEQEYTDEAIQQALEEARRREEEQRALEQENGIFETEKDVRNDQENLEQAPITPESSVSDIMDPSIDLNAEPEDQTPEQAPTQNGGPDFEDYEFDVDQLFDEPL